MEIKWTNLAINDLKEFKENTKMINPKNYILELVKYVDLLKDNHHLGKIYSYINGVIVRQLIYKQHRVFYYVGNFVRNF